MASLIYLVAWQPSRATRAAGNPSPSAVRRFRCGFAAEHDGLGVWRQSRYHTAYAVWVGIGAIGTALYAIFFDGYSASVLKSGCS